MGFLIIFFYFSFLDVIPSVRVDTRRRTVFFCKGSDPQSTLELSSHRALAMEYYSEFPFKKGLCSVHETQLIFFDMRE